MPVDDILGLLIVERDKIERAIKALRGAEKGPKQTQEIEPSIKSPVAGATKRHVSAAARKRMAAAQKRRWAAIKSAK